jgi:hydroxyacylglutathione hydrolase
MTTHILPLLTDNYAYVLEKQGKAAVIDPGEAAPVLAFLRQTNLRLTDILCTHHHGDHIGGVAELKGATGALVTGPDKEQARISGMDRLVKDGDRVEVLGETFEAIETPGHTRGHVCYYAPGLKALFSGDTLFSLGCGRLFEGTAAEMWASLQKLAALPGDTLVYCGHEYTLANGRFCLSHEPDNKALIARMAEIEALRAAGKPTLPVSLASEKASNIFLRAGSAERFAELRALKDQF